MALGAVLAEWRLRAARFVENFSQLGRVERNLDAIDRRILAALQADASLSVAEISERAGVSHSPCWRRIRRLEERGIIAKRVALLDASALNLGLVGYIQIRVARHDRAWLDSFAVFIRATPEVMECHRMTGAVDYLLKVALPDMARYDEIYRGLIQLEHVSDVTASFSMERLKETTELPLDHVRSSQAGPRAR